MPVPEKNTLRTPILALNNVNLTLDDTFTLQNLSFSIGKGESLVLIGPSGAGKTLTLKMIAGLFRPNSGKIEYHGQNIAELNDDERNRLAKIGVLFQRSGLFDSLTVWENITFRLRVTEKLSKTQAIDTARHKLAAVGLNSETAFLYPVELSGGMQKRVGIARALADEPDLLLLDEPTAGLDPIMTNVINKWVRENVNTLGASVLSVTSDLKSARSTADRIVMLNEGKVVWEGTPAQLDTANNPYIDQFVHKTRDGPIRAGFD